MLVHDVRQLEAQRQRQVLHHLLLVQHVRAVEGALVVLHDGLLQVHREAALAHVAADGLHLHLEGVVAGRVHVLEVRLEGADQRGEDAGADDHHEELEVRLPVVPRHDVPVAHGGERRQGEVHGAQVAPRRVPRAHVVAPGHRVVGREAVLRRPGRLLAALPVAVYHEPHAGDPVVH